MILGSSDAVGENIRKIERNILMEGEIAPDINKKFEEGSENSMSEDLDDDSDFEA